MIRVGTGKNVNAGEFMSYNDTSLSPTNVNYLAISTGWGSNGVWMFKKGMETIIYGAKYLMIKCPIKLKLLFEEISLFPKVITSLLSQT